MTVDIAALSKLQRAKLGLVTDDNTGGYYVAECEGCGFVFPSQDSEGGGQIADSGDCDDCYCPSCWRVDPEECDNSNRVWNVQQLKIIDLSEQLKVAQARIAELSSDLDSSNARLHEVATLFANAEYKIVELKSEQKPVVKLPELEKWRSVDSYRAQMTYKSLVTAHLKANGITVEGE